MRKINTYKYRNKTFKAGELTVGWWLLLLEDPEQFVDRYLLEFNTKVPDLDEQYLQAFLWTLLMGKEKKKRSKKDAQVMEDIHITIGMMMKHLGTTYEDIMNMPLVFFEKLCEDIEIIIGTKEYDPKRKSDRVDSKSLLGLKREVFSN